MKRIVLVLILLSFVFSSGYPCEPIVIINESSSVVHLLNGKYKLNVEGILTVKNPSNETYIDELTIPLSLDALIGISKVALDKSSDVFTFKYDKISAHFLSPNSTYRVGYKFYGIIDYNIYEKTNSSILEYYSDNISLVSNVIINLQKPEREDVNTTNVSHRLLSFGVRNPSDYAVKIDYIKVYRSIVGNASINNGVLIFDEGGFVVGPFEYKEIDFFDNSSVNNSVYWMVSKLGTIYNLISSVKRSFQNEEETNPYIGGGGGGSGFRSLIFNEEEVEKLKTDFIIKKATDKTIVKAGDSVTVALSIANLNPYPVENVTVLDTFPDNYDFVKVNNEVVKDGNKLKFFINSMDEYENIVIQYVIKNENKFRGITYLKPAELRYKNESYFSEGVLLINELLPYTRLYVQKEIEYYNDDYALVRIIVKNLGNSFLDDIYISEVIDNDTIIKDISKPFIRQGTWVIKRLGPNEEWEVSFLVSKGSPVLEGVPNVYGISNDKVLKSIIYKDEVVTYYKAESSWFEKVGLSIAVGLLVIYLIF